MRAITLSISCIVFAMIVIPLTGCNSGYKVTGKVVNKGAPIKVSDKGMLQMSFIEESDKDGSNPYPVSVNADGTFTVAGRGSNPNGPTAGKYRVSVRLIDPYPGTDKFGDRYSPKTSKLVTEVKGNDDLTIDIANDAGG
jgi:hypothetical protein